MQLLFSGRPDENPVTVLLNDMQTAFLYTYKHKKETAENACGFPFTFHRHHLQLCKSSYGSMDMTAPANQIKPGNPSIFYFIALSHTCLFWMQTEMVVDVASIKKADKTC